MLSIAVLTPFSFVIGSLPTTSQVVLAKKVAHPKKRARKSAKKRTHKGRLHSSIPAHFRAGSSKKLTRPFQVATGNNVGKDYASTYLQFHKPKSVSPVGGAKSHWRKFRDKDKKNKFDGYWYDLQSIAPRYYKGWNQSNIYLKNSDRPSIVYRNVAKLYTYKAGKGFVKAPKNVDVKVTVVGYYFATYLVEKAGMLFDTDRIGVSHTGGGKSILEYQFLDSKTHKPVAFNQTPVSFWDIDAGQGIGVFDKRGGMQKRVTYRGSAPWLNNKATGAGKKMVWGDGGNHHKLSKTGLKHHGNTNSHDIQGGLTWVIPKDSTLQVEFSFTNWNGYRSMLNPGNTKLIGNNADVHSISTQGKTTSHNSHRKSSSRSSAVKLHSMKITKSFRGHGPGSFYTLASSIYAPAPTFEAGKDAKKDNYSDPKGWTTNLTGIKFNSKNPSATKFAYRFWFSNRFPASYRTGYSKEQYMAVTKKMRITDNDIDQGLSVDKGQNAVQVYTQDVKNGKMTRISQKRVNAVFKITTTKSNGRTHLNIVARSDIKDSDINKDNYKWIFNHMVSFVLPVTGNSNLKGEFKPVNDKERELKIKNVATILGKRPQPPVVIITGDWPEPSKVGENQGHKDVYRLKDEKLPIDKVAKDDSSWIWSSYDGGTVRAGQYLTYTLHFRMGKLFNNPYSVHRYKSLLLTDKLDKHIEKVSHAYIGFANRSKAYKLSEFKGSGGDTVKIDINNKGKLKDFLTKLNNHLGGDIYIRYMAKLKEEDPQNDNDKVTNEAELKPTLQVANKAKYSGYYTETAKDPVTGESHEVQHYIDPKYVWHNPKLLEKIQKYYGNDYNDDDYEADLQRPGFTITYVGSSKWEDSGIHRTIKTNKVVNPYEKPTPPPTTKQYYDKAKNGEIAAKDSEAGAGLENDDYDDTQLVSDSKASFVVTFSPGTMNQDLGMIPKRLGVYDNIDGNLFKVTGYKVFDPDGNDVTYLADSKSSQTSTHFQWYITNKSKLEKLKYNGKPYRVLINVTVRKITKLTSKNNTAVAQYDVPNVTNVSGSTEDWDFQKVEPGLSKSIIGIHDDTTGQDLDSSQVLKPNDKYTIKYALDGSIGTSKDGFSITDSLPEHTKLNKDSVTVSIDQKTPYNIFENNAESGSAAGLSFSTYDKGPRENGFTITGPGGNKFYGSNVHVEYTATVKPEADWADYYNHTVETEAGPAYGSLFANGSDKAIDGDALGIPNVANLKLDDQTLTTAAPFKMGIQTLKLQQYIVQDDDNWTDFLNPSHYLPHTRNDRSAVTTAMRIRMPNYLKIDSAEFMNEAKSAGFDKGQVHTLRVNNKASHASWDSDKISIPNPDFTKSGFATTSPFVGEWKDGLPASDDCGSDAIAGPETLQDVSGKTFYRFTKWAPKTKYYKDYAQLKNLIAGFKANMHLNAHSISHAGEGASEDATGAPEKYDNTYSLNDVRIHLSNIYRYVTKLDDAKYYKDGRNLNYRVYGEVKGLAVDSDHKTVFGQGKEEQPLKAWISTDPNSYKSVPKDAKELSIKPNKALGQGDLYDTLFLLPFF